MRVILDKTRQTHGDVAKIGLSFQRREPIGWRSYRRNVHLKGFRARLRFNNQFLSQKLFTRYKFRSTRSPARSMLDQTNRLLARVPFFFFFEAQTRNLAVLSERDSRKLRVFSPVVLADVYSASFSVQILRQRHFALLSRDDICYVRLEEELSLAKLRAIFRYVDRRNVKNRSSTRAYVIKDRVAIFRKIYLEYYSFHECHLLFSFFFLV